MCDPGQRVQINIKVVPRRCITEPGLQLFRDTAIDEYTRMRYLAAYEEQDTYSSADFLLKAVAYFKRFGILVVCADGSSTTILIQNQ